MCLYCMLLEDLDTFLQFKILYRFLHSIPIGTAHTIEHFASDTIQRVQVYRRESSRFYGSFSTTTRIKSLVFFSAFNRISVCIGSI